MNRVPRIFSYRLVRDYGFAPNPFHGICTLGTCKPQIRKAARVGDIVVGCGSVKLKRQEKLIFAMRVSEKLSFQQYWDDERFAIKRPDLYKSTSRAFGDNIYHVVDGQWVQEESHHSFDEGLLNQANLIRDTSSDSVLLVKSSFTGESTPRQYLTICVTSRERTFTRRPVVVGVSLRKASGPK